MVWNVQCSYASHTGLSSYVLRESNTLKSRDTSWLSVWLLEKTNQEKLKIGNTLGPTNVAPALCRTLPPLSRSASLQYGQQPTGLQQVASGGGGFLTPQGLPSRSSIVTSTPFPGQNVSSLPFTPARPSLQSPLHQPVQPLFTQPTALRQLSTRPLAPASHIRNEPILESDEDDYETSSHGSERKSPRYGTTKDGVLAKAKTVAAVSTGQPMTTPPQSHGGEETPTSRPPSLAVRKKRGSASVRQSVKKTAAESSSSDDDDESSSSDRESGSSSSGSESSSENES